MKKLKDILNESSGPMMGKVYSNPYATAFVRESEEEVSEPNELTQEQRQAFMEAVKQYKTYSESVYRNAGLEEVYESIKNVVEVASRVTLSETGDWFDNVTVGRHMKRMGESFKVFEKTLKEVSTLQQRLESSYDEIGEVLNKYYEINESEEEIEEGNEFGAARAKAIANGDDSFEVDGKKYPVKDVDADDKENAKEFSNESMNEGASTEEKRIVMLAVRKIAKYRNVPINQSVVDVQRAAEELERDIQKGKVKESTMKNNSMKLSSMVNEDVSKEAMGIAALTGTRGSAVQDFIDKNRINSGKLFKALKSANLQGRLNFASALAGKPGNPNEKLTIKLFGESVVTEGKHDDLLDKLADLVGNAKSFMDIGKELKSNGIKYSFGTSPLPMYIIDKPVKIAILNRKYADGAEREVGSTAIGLMESMKMNEAKYDIGMARKGNGITIYNKAEEENGDYKNVAHISDNGVVKYFDKKIPSNIKKMIEKEATKMKESVNESKSIKLKGLLNESFGFGELPSSKLMKMKVSAKDMLDSVNPKKVNEARVSAKRLLQSIVKGETSRIEGIKMSKEMAQSFLDWQRMSPYGKKYGDLPFHMLFRAAFSWGLHRHADKKSKEYKELEAKAKTMGRK